MKVQLVVVQGKPEGKVIPLAIPLFRIGRGETCQLRPNSDQVSREHAEIAISAERVTVRDLGSRNGTIVNGKAITGVYSLKNGDLVQVGPLTFAMSIQGAPVAPAAKAPSLDDVSHDEIDSWLIADNVSAQPESPSGVYGGETITITAYKGGSGPAVPRPDPKSKAPAPPTATPAQDPDEYDRLPEGTGDPEEEPIEEEEESAKGAARLEDLSDESNPFQAAKKAAIAAAAPVQHKDSSSAANDILRKMMERRRASK